MTDKATPSLRQRCDTALQSLPDAEYRAMLARLFDDLLAAQPQAVVPAPGDAQAELVVAIHTLASHFENTLYALRDDAEALAKAKGDIAHAMKIAAKYNRNGAAVQPSQAPVVQSNLEAIRGAVARGWCHHKNSHKAMDSDLALAIADEVSAINAAPVVQAVPENCGTGYCSCIECVVEPEAVQAGEYPPLPKGHEWPDSGGEWYSQSHLRAFADATYKLRARASSGATTQAVRMLTPQEFAECFSCAETFTENQLTLLRKFCAVNAGKRIPPDGKIGGV